MQVKGEHIAIIIITLILTRTVSHLGENCQGVKSAFYDYVNYIILCQLSKNTVLHVAATGTRS